MRGELHFCRITSPSIFCYIIHAFRFDGLWVSIIATKIDYFMLHRVAFHLIRFSAVRCWFPGSMLPAGRCVRQQIHILELNIVSLLSDPNPLEQLQHTLRQAEQLRRPTRRLPQQQTKGRADPAHAVSPAPSINASPAHILCKPCLPHLLTSLTLLLATEARTNLRTFMHRVYLKGISKVVHPLVHPGLSRLLIYLRHSIPQLPLKKVFSFLHNSSVYKTNTASSSSNSAHKTPSSGTNTSSEFRGDNGDKLLSAGAGSGGVATPKVGFLQQQQFNSPASAGSGRRGTKSNQKKLHQSGLHGGRNADLSSTPSIIPLEQERLETADSQVYSNRMTHNLPASVSGAALDGSPLERQGTRESEDRFGPAISFLVIDEVLLLLLLLLLPFYILLLQSL